MEHHSTHQKDHSTHQQDHSTHQQDHSTHQYDHSTHQYDLVMLNKHRTRLLTVSLELNHEALLLSFANQTKYILYYKDLVQVQVQPGEAHNKAKIQANRELLDYSLSIESYAKDQKGRRIYDRCQVFAQKKDRLLALRQQIIQHNTTLYPQEIQQHLNDFVRKQNLLVFVNPNSGKGKADKVSKASMPELQKRGIQLNVIKTEYAGHIHDYLLDMDGTSLADYTGIICVSGDGLPHEVINGLHKKVKAIKDEQVATRVQQIAIGMIDGGTSNSLSHNVTHLANEINSRAIQLFFISKGFTRPMHLLNIRFADEQSNLEIVQQKNKKKKEKDKEPLLVNNLWSNLVEVQSFLSITYGLMADIDLESEKIRCVGSARYTMWGLWRFLRLRTYGGTLYYSTTNKHIPDLDTQLDNRDDYHKVTGHFVYLAITKLPFISPDMNISPLSNQDDQYFDLGYAVDVSRMQVLKLLLGLNTKGSHTKYTKQVKAKSFRFVPEQRTRQSYYSIDGEKYPPRSIQAHMHHNAFLTYSSK